MSKVQNKNYVTLHGWMINDLHLKGNELLIYAIIYSFSQDGETRFSGSLQYLIDWTRSSKQTVITCLKSLINKKLIVKDEKMIGNVKLCEYWSNFLTTGQIFRPVKFFDQGGQIFRHNNKANNNNNKSNNTENNNTNISNSSINNINNKKNNIIAADSQKPLWRTSFEAYIANHDESYQQLISDTAYLAELKKFNPSLDILLSLENAKSFWGSEAGWSHKKKQRTKDLNWKLTYRNAVRMPANRVYDDKKAPNKHYGRQELSQADIDQMMAWEPKDDMPWLKPLTDTVLTEPFQ